MTDSSPPLPDFSVDIDDSGHSQKYTVTADLTDLPGEREELTHTGRSLETVLEEAGKAVHFIRQHGDVHTDRGERGRRAVRILLDTPGVVKAQYRPWTEEVWLTTTSFDTGRWDEIAFFAGLEENWWRIDHRREHGVVLDLEYSIHPFAPAIPDHGWDDAAERLHDRDPYTDSDTDVIAELYHEYDDTREVVRNEAIRDGDPRLAGTTALAYHIYYLNKTHDDLMKVVNEVYPKLTEEDVEVALEYAADHREEAEAYVDRQVKQNEALKDLIDG